VTILAGTEGGYATIVATITVDDVDYDDEVEVSWTLVGTGDVDLEVDAGAPSNLLLVNLDGDYVVASAASGTLTNVRWYRGADPVDSTLIRLDGALNVSSIMNVAITVRAEINGGRYSFTFRASLLSPSDTGGSS